MKQSLLEKDIQELHNDLLTNNFNAKNCANYINHQTQKLLTYGEKSYLTPSQLQYMRSRNLEISNKLFLMRVAIREKFAQFTQNNTITPQCITALRKAYRYSRFLEEYITELTHLTDNRKANVELFKGQVGQLYLNPKYKTFELKHGDVLLLRSTSFVGATVARIGDDDGQFSHAALVIKTESGKTMILESLISKGLVYKPYKEWQEENHSARIMQFRLKKQEQINPLVNRYLQKVKHHVNNGSISYDFQMNENDHDKLFCSEIILHTYSTVGLPSFRTEFKAFKNHSFLKNLTIETSQAFSPNDIEIEPNFELISEWRNYDKTEVARIQDAVMSSILKWMVEDDYELRTTFKSSLATPIAYYGRHLFGLKSNDIPENMPYGFIKTMIELDDLNSILKDYMIKQNEKHLEEYGYSMSYPKMIALLEELKIEDLKHYEIMRNNTLGVSQKAILFHTYFNP